MANLAIVTEELNFQLRQVRDFTPIPMTVSTETWYTGYGPYMLEPVYYTKIPNERLAQQQFFFWYKPEEGKSIERELRKIGRPKLIEQLFSHAPEPPRTSSREDEASPQRTSRKRPIPYNPNSSNKRKGEKSKRRN